VILNYVDNPNERVPLLNNSITLTPDCQLSFSIPFDGVVCGVYATFSVGSLAPNAYIEHMPYVQIFQADAGSNRFHPIGEAKAVLFPGVPYGAEVNTAFCASSQDIGAEVALGTRLLVVALLEVAGEGSKSLTDYWNISGGLAICTKEYTQDKKAPEQAPAAQTDPEQPRQERRSQEKRAQSREKARNPGKR
jgi:hypothetical protein